MTALPPFVINVTNGHGLVYLVIALRQLTSHVAAKTSKANNKKVAEVTDFELLSEISCGATIGSLVIGYNNFCDLPQQQDFAKIYIPCNDKDKILVLSLGDSSGL